jgi:hypothetical protein
MLDPRQLAARTRRFVARVAGDPLGTEGAIFTEYAVVVGVCGLVISLAILMMGTTLSTNYYQARQVLIAPEP